MNEILVIAIDLLGKGFVLFFGGGIGSFFLWLAISNIVKLRRGQPVVLMSRTGAQKEYSLWVALLFNCCYLGFGAWCLWSVWNLNWSGE